MRVFFYSFFLTAIITFTSCNTGKNPSNQTNEDNKTENIITEKDSGTISYVFLSPAELFEFIFSNEWKPNPSIVNPTSNAAKYITASAMSVNLGVYTADFIYLNFEKSQPNSLEYFKAISELSPKVNIYNWNDEDFAERFRKNLTNKDSMLHLSQLVYYNILEDLENDGRKKTYSLIAGGVIIESIYLAVSNIENYNNSKLFIDKIFQQRDLLNNTYKFIASNNTDPDLTDMLTKLEDIKKCFDNLLSTKKDLQVTRKNNKLKIEGGSENIISINDFDNLKSVVTGIRNEIISGS